LLDRFAKQTGLTPENVELMKEGNYGDAVTNEDKTGVLDKVEARNANKLFDEEPYGMNSEQAEKMQDALVRGLRYKMAPQQFGEMVAQFNPKQLDRFKNTLKSAVEGVGGGVEGAERILGKELREYLRDNGGVRSRGVTSDELWGEKGRGGTEQDIAGGRGESTPPPAPSAAPQPSSGSSGSTSGGGGGSSGGGESATN
jgi:hypothetical protein